MDDDLATVIYDAELELSESQSEMFLRRSTVRTRLEKSQVHFSTTGYCSTSDCAISLAVSHSIALPALEKQGSESSFDS